MGTAWKLRVEKNAKAGKKSSLRAKGALTTALRPYKGNPTL